MKTSKKPIRQRKPKKRIFDGMANAASQLGVDIATLKWAKEQGCPAFIAGGTIHEDVLNVWLKTAGAPPDASSLGLKEQKIAEEIRKLRNRNDREEGKVVAIAWVSERTREVASRQRVMLIQKLEREYPGVVTGLEPPQARVYGKRLVDEICGHMQDLASLFEDLKAKSELTGSPDTDETATGVQPGLAEA